MQLLTRIKGWASRIKRDTLTLWFAVRDARTPWLAKALGVFVVAYALSPIDLIPDFIPVLGFVDDALLLPGLIWLAVRLIPSQVLDESRAHADRWIAADGARPRSYVGAAIIVIVWIAAIALLTVWALRRFGGDR